MPRTSLTLPFQRCQHPLGFFLSPWPLTQLPERKLFHLPLPSPVPITVLLTRKLTLHSPCRNSLAGIPGHHMTICLVGLRTCVLLSLLFALCSKVPMEPSLTCCSFLCSSCSGLGPADHVPCPPQSPSFLLAGFPCEQSSWSSGMRSSLCLSSEAHKATATAGWMNGGMDGWMSGAVKTVSK